MQNPWGALPTEPPFVLPDDRERVGNHNEMSRDEHHVHSQCMPEPYIGNLRVARVVLLQANPGYDRSDDLRFSKSSNIRIWRANLQHEDHGFLPLFVIDPRLASETHDWFRKKLRTVIDEFGLEHVGRLVASAELYPYHTREFSSKLVSVADAYTAQLVRDCVDRGVVFIVRNRRTWASRIPELVDYPRIHERRSPQQATVSQNNLEPEVWQQIRSALRGESSRRSSDV